MRRLYIQRRKPEELDEELYDLLADPGETRDRKADHPALVLEMRKRVLAITRMNDELARADSVEEVELDEATIRELRSLGYMK